MEKAHDRIVQPSGVGALRLVYLAVALLGFLAASSAPTPLYQLYQHAWQFSPATLTLVFAVYALSLLAALLTVGSLSDYLGRRPVIFVALLLESVAMLLFIQAESVPWLLAARLLQGFATGMATSVLGAALLDTDREQGPLVNSLAPLLGMACGALGTSVLVEFAPWPLRLVYGVLLALFVVLALLVWRLPESVSRQPGALRALRRACWCRLRRVARCGACCRLTLRCGRLAGSSSHWGRRWCGR